MAVTRSKSYVYLIGEPKERFTGRVLPTGLEVLQVYMHHLKKHSSQKKAVTEVMKELVGIWDKTRIPICEERNITRKLVLLLKKYRAICRNKKRGGSAQKEREKAFANSLNSMLDIAHHKALDIIKIEEDKVFLEDQRSARQYVIGGVDAKLAEIERNREMRLKLEAERKVKEQKRKLEETETATLSSSSCSSCWSEDDSPYCVKTADQNAPIAPSKKRKQAKVASSAVITPAIVSALDRTKTSNRNAAYLQKEEHLPKEDYRELLELTLIFLGTIPPRGCRFRAPGALHHARWMSKVLYVLKMYVFRHQFKLTPKEEKSCLEFGLFAALIYVKYWISAPNSCDAPLNDLGLIKILNEYKKTFRNISISALKAIGRHLWYLSQEMSPIAIFSDLVSVDNKRFLVQRLLESQEIAEERNVRYNGTEDLSKAEVQFFLGHASHLFFTTLQLDMSFFKENPENWDNLASYQEARKIARALKVVNDGAERGIAIATDFNGSLTKDEAQKQFLLQVVEDHRKRFPNTTKTAVKA